MSTAYRFDPTILREYDIRGIVGKTLNPSDAEAVGRGFGTMVRRRGGKRVCVGYDGRLSSPALEEALVAGLVSVGLDVDRIGLGPTPMLYFAARDSEADAGIMITGSHNPPEYNGIKMMLGKEAVWGKTIQEIGVITAAADYATGTGSSRKVDVREAYVERLLRDYDGTRDLKVAWDAGNGSGGEILEMLVKKLPGTHVVIYSDIDGTFPNHHPDPTIESNMADLKKVVLEQGCDLGIGFDGDADRIGCVDETGTMIWGDQLVAIYASDVCATHPGAIIIGDVKCSVTMFDEIKRVGGTPLMWKTGHSLAKAKMAETGSPLAGEMSGHIFFGDKFYGHDDALYCGVRLVSLLSRQGGKASDLRKRFPEVFNTPEVRFQIDESRKFPVIDEIVARCKALKDVEIVDIDGVRVTTADGWWLLRASNTQDVLVTRAEARSPAGLERLKAMVIDQLKVSGAPVPDFNNPSGGH
jgi:phosphomannomutase